MTSPPASLAMMGVDAPPLLLLLLLHLLLLLLLLSPAASSAAQTDVVDEGSVNLSGALHFLQGPIVYSHNNAYSRRST